MSREVDVCPKCGALITPHLSSCRQCGRYLQGTWFEGVIVENLLPPALRTSPGTGILFLLIVVFYGLQILATRQVLAFSPFTLRQLGAVIGARIWLGEYWRFVTAMFAHGDAVHIAFNLSWLVAIGPPLEELFDRKKVWFLGVVSGVLSMVCSHVWYVEVWGAAAHTTVGSSGAVSGFVGCAITAGRRLGPESAQLVARVTRLAIFMLVLGLILDGIDNAAHLGGFAVGALMGRLMPLGPVRTVRANTVLSATMLGALAGIAVCFGLMLASIQGQPRVLGADLYPTRMFFFTVTPGTPFKESTQYDATLGCRRSVATNADDAVEACRWATRVFPEHFQNWVDFGTALEEGGPPVAAERRRVLRVLTHLSARAEVGSGPATDRGPRRPRDAL